MGMKVYATATGEADVTPSDSTEVTCDALYIGTTGDVAIARSAAGSAVVYHNVPVGYLMVQLRNGRVMATGTSASDIVSVVW